MRAKFFCAIVGLLKITRLGTSQPAIGDVWVMNSIAALVMGGAVLGACILIVIQNTIVVLIFR